MKKLFRLCIVLVVLFGMTKGALAANGDEPIISTTMLLLSGGATIVSDIAFSPGTIYSGEETVVNASIALQGTGMPSSIMLVESNENGDALSQVTRLYDNGDLSLGDDIPNDGVYHGQFSITPNDDTDLFYKVINPQSSDPARLAIVNNVSNVIIGQAQIQATQAKNAYDTTPGSDAVKQAAVMAYLDTLGSDIAEKGTTTGGSGTWWITDDGIPVVHNPEVDDPSIRAGGAVRNPDPPLLQAINERGPNLPVNKDSRTLLLKKGASSYPLQAEGDNEVESKEALLLRIYNFGADELPEIQANLESLCYTTTLVNLTTNLNHFKNLFQYGVVAVVGHGDTFYQGWQTFWFPEWGSERGAAQVIINMPVAYNPATMKKDLLAGRLALTPSNQVAVMPSFISYYNSNLPNSLIYIGTCRSGRNNSMANAFLNDGAGTYFGFTDYVGTSWAEDRGENLFDHLTGGDTTGTNPENGMTETDGDPATFVIFGANDLVITTGPIANGDFEKGTLAGWSPAGDARVITSLGVLSPPQGSYMAIISTGLGSVFSSTSTLTQKVSPTADDHILTFRYNVVSEEPLEFVGSVYDDKFGVAVEGGLTVLETINTSSWIALGGNYFSGGDDTTYHTGWKTYTIDLSAYIDACVEIEFRTWDVGDSIYDTATLIDDIQLN